MTTRIRSNGFKSVASVAAAGLLAVLSMTAGATQASAGTIEAAAWLGQIEVTAPVTRFVANKARDAVADLGSMTVTAVTTNLGAMTVTATRIPTVASRAAAAPSTGETDNARARSPRAVLVQ
jgi:hypothetical protein